MSKPIDPQDHDAEDYVLGAIMLDARALDETSTIIGPDDFSRPSRGIIYRTSIGMRAAGQHIDAVTLWAELERAGVKDVTRADIHTLAQITPAWTNAIHYARVVRHTADARAVLRVAEQLDKAGRNGGLVEHPEVIEQMRHLLEGRRDGNTIPGLDLTELLSGPVPETDWLWNGWIATDDVALLVGDPKVGKSLVGLGLANAVRNGTNFLGEPCAKANVGIFDLENPLSEIHKRLRRVGLTHDNHTNLHYWHMPALNLTRSDNIAQLRATIETNDLKLVILDSFRRCAPGVDENDSAAISQFFAPLRQITTGGRAILIIHHARKRTGGDQDQDPGQMTRGSGDFLAAVDVQMYAKRKGDGTFTLQHGASRRGTGHDAIVVRVSAAEDDTLTFTNDGIAIAGDSKRTAMLADAITELRNAGGGPLSTSILMMRMKIEPKTKRTFYDALNLGYAEGWLAKSESGNKRQPTEWALASDPQADA